MPDEQYTMSNNNEVMPFDMPLNNNSIIKVIGVGGGGGNAVNHMYNEGISDVTFAVCNTDRQILMDSPIPVKIQLGTEGLGAGNVPEVARKAAEESIDSIQNMLNDGTRMVFITAGMGGGTGTGAAPVIARIAKERGILTVGIVTIPFRWEGDPKIDQALDGVEAISKQVDALLVINNEKLFEVYSGLSVDDAFEKADETLSVAARSISEIITTHGKINLDFNDVKTVMTNGGVAIMSTGYGKGEGRVTMALQNAQNSPLLNNNNIFDSKRVLLNVSYSSKNKLMMSEMAEVSEFMGQFRRDFKTKWGTSINDSLEDQVKITLLASGFGIQDIHMKEMDERISTKSAEEIRQQAELEKKEEMLRGRRETYYGPGSATKPKNETYLFILEENDLDNDELINELECTPTYLRTSKDLKKLISKRVEEESITVNPNNGGDETLGVITF